MQLNRNKASAGLVIGSLGVVFGDIGTSPIYAFGLAFAEDGPFKPLRPEILGTLSLIIWALIIVVCIKYVLLILRVDNDGEGGILAVMARAQRGLPSRSRLLWVIAPLGIIGTAFFLADSTITPAISVLSAIEGLEVLAPQLQPLVVPICIAILASLFMIQHYGTERVGNLFGPVMSVWFLTLGVFGLLALLRAPEVLWAFDPRFAIALLREHHTASVVILGIVVLAVTGVEALYADMGHFGRPTIRTAWFFMVFPALLLNYLGQGALLLSNPKSTEHTFFSLAPEGFLLPLVILATLATIIASQAVISGAFSICRQAVQLGYLPRLHVRHTSSEETGQIYVGRVNWLLLAMVLFLVASFGSSSKLADAYGIAVSGAMLMDLILAGIVFWRSRPLDRGWIVLVFMLLFVVDVTFFGSTLTRLPQGGYLPVMMSIALYFMMTTWKRGRDLMLARERADPLAAEDFIGRLAKGSAVRVPGTAIFMAAEEEGLPRGLLHNLKHNKVLHERVILLSVSIEDEPRTPASKRSKVEPLGHGFFRVALRFGFMEEPDVPRVLRYMRDQGLEIDMQSASFFVGQTTIVPAQKPQMALWRERLFIAMSRNAQSATDYFCLPTGQVVELGVQVQI